MDATLTTSEADLLRAVVAEPESDPRRLVYADFLDDRDGPGDRDHAEFVRAQVELAGLPHPGPGHLPDAPASMWTRAGGRLTDDSDPPCACDFCRRKRREQGLLSAMHSRAIVRVGYVWGLDLDFPGPCPWEFRRGFVESVRVPLAAWLGHREQMLASTPLREVALTLWQVVSCDGGIVRIRPDDRSVNRQPWRLAVHQGALYSVDEYGPVEVVATEV